VEIAIILLLWMISQDIHEFSFLVTNPMYSPYSMALLKELKNEFDFKVKKIRSDNGSEFKNFRIEDYCDEKGIKHKFSAVYTSEQNRVVERKDQTLIDMARSMLSKYNVSDSF
jgi:transposase InsO family protein